MIQEAFSFAVEKSMAVFSFWNLLGVFATLVYFYWWRRPHPKFPPGPRGLPIVGNTPFLGVLPSRSIKKWSLEKYGDIMSVRMGRDEVVVLNTFDTINQALVKQSASYSDRPWLEIARSTGYDGIGAKRYDDAFKVQKHFGLRFLREKGLARQRMEEIINVEGDEFVKFLHTFEDKPIDFKKYFYWLTSNIISKVALGNRYDYGDPKFHKLLDVLSNFFGDAEDAPLIEIVNLFPLASRVPPFSMAMKRYDKRQETILECLQKYIDEHKEKFDPNNINDFIDAFLYENQFGTKMNTSFTERQLRAYCRDLFIAGSETSSSTLAWCFAFLLNYPEYFKIIEREVSDTIGSEKPSMSHREHMPMTCAFIQEVMRNKTLAPLSITHLTSETTELMGYVIPKGIKVIPNLDGAHMDPKTWPNPEEFNPRRHIDENGKFVASNKIIPFSVGARFCLGESLARAEIFIFLTKLIQNFKVRSAKDYLPPLDQEIMSLVLSPKECEVVLEAK